MKYLTFLNILNFPQGVNFSFFEKTLNFSVIFGKNLKTLWITMSPSPSFSLFLLTLTLCVCPNLNSQLSDQGNGILFNTKGSRIARILLCLKYDLQPELGSGLPSRWRLRPTLPGSRVTRRS